MVAFCFYFQLHQPFRIQHCRIKNIGQHNSYFNHRSNKAIFEKVAQKCNWPTGRMLTSLLKQFSKEFKLTFSITGTFLDQYQEFDPKYRYYHVFFQCLNFH